VSTSTEPKIVSSHIDAETNKEQYRVYETEMGNGHKVYEVWDMKNNSLAAGSFRTIERANAMCESFNHGNDGFTETPDFDIQSLAALTYPWNHIGKS
jgi:hypothetical protein